MGEIKSTLDLIMEKTKNLSKKKVGFKSGGRLKDLTTGPFLDKVVFGLAHGDYGGLFKKGSGFQMIRMAVGDHDQVYILRSQLEIR